MKRIKISGAGPAGLSAAINLAKAGYEVDVFEKNKDVGKHFCGGIQGLENWSEVRDIVDDLKGMNIAINFDCDPFSHFMVSNTTENLDLSFDRPAFYLVKRGPVAGSLDLGLKEQALRSGARIHFGETIPEEQADIIATGPIKKEIAGVVKGIVFDTKMDDIAIILVGDRFAFKGYSYLLVTKGKGCMCTFLCDQFENVNRCLEETKRAFSSMLDLDINNPRPDGGIGSFSNRNRFQYEDRLYVGEAAGLQDFLWGFGIRTAITSGFLAARSIIDNGDYEIAVRKCFEKKLKAGVVNRFLWERSARNDYSSFFDRMHNAKNPRKYLHSIYNFNHLQKLAYPFALQAMKKRYKRLRL